MKISNFEKYIVEHNISDEVLTELLKNINETLEYDFSSSRKLTDEEIDYEYFDNYIVEFIESSNLNNEDKEEQDEICNCHHNGHHYCDYSHEVNEQDKEDRFNKSMGHAHIMAMYLLREGILYIDLVQEALLGLAKANNIYSKNSEFEKYSPYFMAKEIIEYIKRQVVYRKSAFKQYIEAEKDKEIKLKLSPKVRLKERNEEIKKVELEKKEEHKKEILRLEEITKNMFDYFNLKYRLSIREIEALSLYFGLGNKKRKSNFSDIEKAMNISLEEVDKLLKESIFKLSVVNEKIKI